LEVKRSKFPRFYFLGDEDLLEILAQAQNPTVIQLHLKKLFAAIHSVGFTGDNREISEIYSIEKERVILSKRVELTESVETWFNTLEQRMFATLEQSLRDYINSGTREIKLAEYPSQILCLMEEIRFTAQLEEAIRAKNLKGIDSQLKVDLQNLTRILPTVARLEALKLKAIILDLIHHLNIVSVLLREEKAVALTSYNFKKNFRMTAVPELHLFDYKYKYTFEYQGNLPKLVHTPLPDKCYITLSLALSLGLGGNPYGPAGTGKTETVKAMAMLFGRMCLVFNCDEGLDYKSMARIFLGLVKCGAWGCFDEFNRLLEEQLSAISQQIQVIQFAIKANQSHLELIGRRVEVNPNSGIFVTLNPAGKGYGGRSRLPDNLKQLFRPVAMSIPDNELIAEVLLYAEGFKEAKQLSQKVICLFTLSKQLLSYQQHYDWGLRALKTILSVAGRLIFEHRTGNKGQEITLETECELLIKAIRINTFSKLTFTDMRKFKSLLNDIFPGVESKDIVY
jgi:dynein heavy chain 2